MKPLKGTLTCVAGFRTIDIHFDAATHGLTFWKCLWGADIWINGIPVLKTLILAVLLTNVGVWAVLVWALR